ncbi:MAG: ATP-grasp domain-containing protein [Parvularculaceae bacterium]|nr:ATP-grasp domain-containing protein [Parvularculaceae bacterium]
MFRKILIANRGEIAIRVAKTARRLGIAAVAVYSDADESAPHARFCDEAIRIGGPKPADSYLRIDRIIDACVKSGADAVHPGYGFLSENAEFAEALEKAGIVFIGPTAQSIRAMGSKSAAKDLMEKAGVPTTPGYQGADQSLDVFRRECARIGYPVLLKATAGGGGKGMKIAAREADLAEALASAQREGKNSFGDDRVLVEKYVPRARHLEVQIVGDGKGEVVHFFERDCSVQRRHQKIIEEAPAPRLPADVRRRLHEIGVNAGKAVQYRGAGTVECLYDGGANVYFMEMNTRLQVEHPVTEMITGVDLVEWQIRVAAGEGLPLKQDDIHERGHAFEARLYAEDPDNSFAPSIGRLTTLRLSDQARVDSGVEEGQEITPYYDPMIAKIITHGASRVEALGRMRAALRETRVAGVETNACFLHALCADGDFASGDVSTKYIDEHPDGLFARPAADARVYGAALLARHLAARAGGADPWGALTGFRLNKAAKAIYWIDVDGAPAIARLFRHGQALDIEIEPRATAAARKEGKGGGESMRFSVAMPSPPAHPGGVGLRLSINGEAFDAFVAPHGGKHRVFIGAESWDVSFPDPLSGAGGHHSVEGSLVAPMPGVVTLLKAKPGEAVAAGAVLMVMEAMKMEHAIKAPHDGTIKAFRFKAGDQVRQGDMLVEFEETA